ncbi:MAG: hypothetical protein WBE18_00340 [Gammaproteobacteria bacterium]
MKKILNKISTSLICAMLFAVIFIGIGTLLAMAYFGMDFGQKLLSTHTLAEKWRQGISFYLAAMLTIFVLLLFCNHRKLFNSSYRLMAVGGLCGILMLPLSVIVGYLLSGSVISFETIFVVAMLPLLLRVFIIVPLALALLSGIISGFLYYGYRKIFYSPVITPLPELTASEIL